MTKTIFIVFAICATLFTRFYNMPYTSRFTRDESSNLMDMHRIYVDKQITMIGPIDVVNYVIYPSLTFYMLLPFAILGNFSTYSPAFGTVFYGIISMITMLLLIQKLNKNILIPICLLLILWSPLIESSRWAWNPHLVPFTTSIAILLWYKKYSWSIFLSGIFFGLSFHLHYFSLISTGLFMLVSNKKFKHLLINLSGFILTILPFIIFDYRNPPGLFFGRFLHNNLITENFSNTTNNLVFNIFNNLHSSVLYLIQEPTFASIGSLLILLILISDIKSKSNSLIYFIPFIAQVIAISILPQFAGRYVLLGICFLTIWLSYPRSKFITKLIYVLLGVIILGNLTNIINITNKPQIEPGAKVVEIVSRKISEKIDDNDLKNVNLAVLQSPDNDPLGTIYRHTLLVKEKRILPDTMYETTDNLFVITTSDEKAVRNDHASIINRFRDGKAIMVANIKDTNWKIYLFNRN